MSLAYCTHSDCQQKMKYVKFVTDDKYNQCVSCVIQEKVVTLHLLKKRTIRDVAQLVSVRVWGACGRQFESGHPDKEAFVSLFFYAQQIMKIAPICFSQGISRWGHYY